MTLHNCVIVRYVHNLPVCLRITTMQVLKSSAPIIVTFSREKDKEIQLDDKRFADKEAN